MQINLENSQSPMEAKRLAQFIAMAPFVFQATVCLRDFGVIKALIGSPGMTMDELLSKLKINRYGLSILVDAGESAGILTKQDDKISLTQAGVYLEEDPIVRVNLDFSQDVCYQGLFHLKESIEKNKPAGLKEFGTWPTIYEGLSQLPAKAKESWFAFDHFFSSDSFPRVMSIVFARQPKRIMDVGGNTGKFALACQAHDPDVRLTIVDHPGQIAMAQKNFPNNDRIQFHGTDMLDHSQALPKNHDAIWMSQFLCCFSHDEIVKILSRAREAMSPETDLFIMETFTDNQRFDLSAFCLNMTSLYFTAMANGNSRMYPRTEFLEMIRKAGLEVVEEFPVIRFTHTILRLRRPPEGR